MSHLASADEPRNIMNKKQINKFEEIIQNFKESQHSLANSNGIINLKQIEFNIVRSGGCLFGTIENNHFKNIIELYKGLQIGILSVMRYMVIMVPIKRGVKKELQSLVLVTLMVIQEY